MNVGKRPRQWHEEISLCFKDICTAALFLHVVVGTCMVAYWQHGRWMGVMRCPVCRQTVSLECILVQNAF